MFPKDKHFPCPQCLPIINKTGKNFMDWPNHTVHLESPEDGVIYAICVDCFERSGPFTGPVGMAAKNASNWAFNHNFDVYLEEQDKKLIKKG